MPSLTRAPTTLLRTTQHLALLSRTSTAAPSSLLTLARTSAQFPSLILSPSCRRPASTQSTHGAAAHTQTGEAHDAAAHDHGEHSMYDAPGGWLWGVPPGEEYKKEGWEGLWYYGFCGSLLLAVVAYAFKPDTSIETWALEEAKRRLQIEGLLPEED